MRSLTPGARNRIELFYCRIDRDLSEEERERRRRAKKARRKAKRRLKKLLRKAISGVTRRPDVAESVIIDLLAGKGGR